MEISYQEVNHISGDPFEGLPLDADDNACVDFRYCDSDRMTWWFRSPRQRLPAAAEARAHFDLDTSGQKFYDPSAVSQHPAAGARARREVRLPAARAHVRGGRVSRCHRQRSVPDPRGRRDPGRPGHRAHGRPGSAQQGRQASGDRYIREIVERPMEELVTVPWIREPLELFLIQHRETIELIRNWRRVPWRRGARGSHERPHRQLQQLHLVLPVPRLALHRGPGLRRWQIVRVTAGHNPWSGKSRHHNIAEICERFGGGGHPFVGGVTCRAAGR